jgi:hypothetical protein
MHWSLAAYRARDLSEQAAGDRCIPVFVHEFHCAKAPAIAKNGGDLHSKP